MIDEKAEKILNRLIDEDHILMDEFNYLMGLLKDTGKGSVLITDITAVPRGYEAWREHHFKGIYPDPDKCLIINPIPQSKL